MEGSLHPEGPGAVDGPPLPSNAAAVELREAIIAQQDALAKLMSPETTLMSLRGAALGAVLAEARVESAMSAVKIECGVLDLPILQDERPRLARDVTPTDG